MGRRRLENLQFFFFPFSFRLKEQTTTKFSTVVVLQLEREG
jgi:hypothetical protein